MKDKLIIRTHNGIFHADEVFACALLKLIYNEVEIIRSRDDTIIADLYIDIGGIYDGQIYFDHHFKEFKIYHDKEHLILKASFGLIWNKFAHFLITNKEVENKIKNVLVIPIDAHDNGVIKNCKRNSAIYFPYTISNAISSFNRQVNNDLQFNKALLFAQQIIENIIENITIQFKDESLLLELFDNTTTNYVIFDRFYNYSNIVKNEKYSHITHLIFPENNEYRAIALKNNLDILKAPFPKEWGGLINENLVEVSKIQGCIFCHKMLWIAVNKTLDGIIQMVESCY